MSAIGTENLNTKEEEEKEESTASWWYKWSLMLELIYHKLR